MLTVTLDTSTLRLVDALAALDGLDVDVATTTVTAREVEGTGWAQAASRLHKLPEVMVLGQSPLGVAALGGETDRDNYEGLLLLLSGGGFPKSGKRSQLTEGEEHLLRDVMILTAHARERRDIFVSNDTKAIGRAGQALRERLYQDFGIWAMTLDEFTAYAARLRAGESSR